MEITFSNPQYLWFLLVIPLIIFSHFFSLRVSRGKALKFANFGALSRIDSSKIVSRNWTLLFLRIAVISLIILAIASPIVWYWGLSSDLEYIVAIDASGSMLADDFEPNRLEAAKSSASIFIEGVSQDTKVGVISFSGNTFVEQRPTNDMKMVEDEINSINVRYSSGTAIGDAIITSSNLFEHGTVKSKVLMLLTDGQNTVGTSVEEALKYAKESGVTIYTLGVGTKEGARFGAVDVLSKIDETSLKEIAFKTGGLYYPIEDKEQLINAFRTITSKNRKKIPFSLSFPLMIFILILLALEWGFMSAIYKVAP